MFNKSGTRFFYKHIGAGFLKSDGHCSFAPDEERMATDENVGSRLEKRRLLYIVRTKEQAVLGMFPILTKAFMGGDQRCDLHPRWNRDGTATCVDALAGAGTRQLHVAELG